MARKIRFDPKSPEAYRKSLRESQTVFWTRFGVTQSAGSRYESGRTISTPTAMLMSLWASKIVTDADIIVAKMTIAKANRKTDSN